VTDATRTAPPKLDPESLAIRAHPPRAIRFKRKAIIAIAAAGSISLTAVTWMALKPRLIQTLEAPQDLSQPETQPAGDALAKAPTSYGDVPRVGPPLPGDLGKPILERQQQLAAETGAVPAAAQERRAVDQERRLADLKAARASGLLVQRNQDMASGSTAPAAPTVPVAAATSDKLALDPERDPNAQARKMAFVGAADREGDINPHAIGPLASPFTLSAGSVIAASLITGLRSDLPGLVIARVTENTYDSATGQILLVPQGARLIGTYDSVVAFGQKRALIVWQRIILPNGASLRIDNVPATDVAGFSGIADQIDVHTWQLLRGVALSTLLGVGSDLALSGRSDLVQAIRMSTQDNVSRAGDQITQRNLGVQPTITVRPGVPVRLVVHKDLVFDPAQVGDAQWVR